jgi:hypothetical protein
MAPGHGPFDIGRVKAPSPFSACFYLASRNPARKNAKAPEKCAWRSSCLQNIQMRASCPRGVTQGRKM